MNKCCNQPINIKQLNEKEFGAWCQTCGRKGKGNNADAAINQLYNSNAAIAIIPRNSNQLIQYATSNINNLMEISAPFVASDQPAFKKMIANNIRYVKNRKDEAFLKCWETPEGQESIVYALEEAFSLGAQLGKMGDLVPYGQTVEYIPSVEAFEFALTNGNNAPFEWLSIEAIHEKDIHKTKRINGEFTFEIEPGSPRGKLISIVVYGKNRKLNKVIGEKYDAERLLKKAKQHSAGYKYYLQDKAQAEVLRSEGKILNENGREYFIKKMYKKGGGSWDLKKFLDEITNPYEGPNQPEMLRKMAGKTFLRPFIKVRNSEAAINEIKESEDNIDSLIDNAMEAAFETIPGEKEENTKQDNKKGKKTDLSGMKVNESGQVVTEKKSNGKKVKGRNETPEIIKDVTPQKEDELFPDDEQQEEKQEEKTMPSMI